MSTSALSTPDIAPYDEPALETARVGPDDVPEIPQPIAGNRPGPVLLRTRDERAEQTGATDR